MEGICFKVRFEKHLSRFRLPSIPSWSNFVDLLEGEIFKETDSHKSVCLQHLASDTIINSEEEWQVFAEQIQGQTLIRLDVIEHEPCDNKEKPAAEEKSSPVGCGGKENLEKEEKKSPVNTQMLYYATTPSIYKTQVKYPDEDRWCPFSQFEISIYGECKLGNNTISNLKQEENSFSWEEDNENQCSGKITLSEAKDSFEGHLRYPNCQDNILFRAEELKDEKKEETLSVPSFLAPFFPNRRIFLYDLPEILKGSVRLIPVNDEASTVYFDIDMGQLGQKIHARAIELLKEAKYDNAQTLLVCLSEMSPSSIGFYNLACCYALQQNSKDAFAALGKACEHGYSNSELMCTDPDLLSLHEHEEFWNLVGIVNS